MLECEMLRTCFNALIKFVYNFNMADIFNPSLR